MSRRELREHIFRLIFRNEFHDQEAMPEQLQIYLEDLASAKDKDKVYIEEKYNNLLSNLEQIDNSVNAIAEGWSTTRMGKVDLAITRLAAYEILLDDDVPAGVAINEAVELAKKFGGEESSVFINGVLAKLVP
jgi:transcription antitermination factor NusB